MLRPFRKMDTRRLHATEIKQLVRILRNGSNTQVDQENTHAEKTTVNAIKLLPRRLRAHLLSSHGSLCQTHKGLDHHLIDDIWAWVKFELETAIGRFIYPLVMSGTLSTEDEHRIRQLEPVVEMILPGWTLAESAPPGKRPIHTGTNWAYQKNGCTACMLSRIGSDTKALFALYAGMFGHLKLRNSNAKKSKRLRMIRYWMRTHPGGEEAAVEAYELGTKLKASRRDAKALLRQGGQSARYKRNSIGGPPATAHHHLDYHSEAAVDVSDPYNPKDWTKPPALDVSDPYNPKDWTEPPALDVSEPFNPKDWTASTVHDPKLGPTPSNKHTSIESQTKPPHSAKRTSLPPLKTERDVSWSPVFMPSDQRIHSAECDELAPLPTPSAINRTNNKRTTLKRHDSVISNKSSFSSSSSSSSSRRPPRTRSSSIYSTATSIASYNGASDSSPHSRGFDPMETPEERLEKYRKLLEPSWKLDPPADDSDDEGTIDYENTFNFRGFLLPKPSRTSMYSGFGDEAKKGDVFEVCDLTPPPSPIGEGFEGCEGEVDGNLVPEGLALSKK